MTTHRQHVCAVNLTRHHMSKIVITHNGGEKTKPLEVDELSHGTMSECVDIIKVSGSPDRWQISALIGDQQVTIEDKHCGLPNSGGTTAIVFHEELLTIATPDNSPCTESYG